MASTLKQDAISLVDAVRFVLKSTFFTQPREAATAQGIVPVIGVSPAGLVVGDRELAEA